MQYKGIPKGWDACTIQQVTSSHLLSIKTLPHNFYL